MLLSWSFRLKVRVACLRSSQNQKARKVRTSRCEVKGCFEAVHVRQEARKTNEREELERRRRLVHASPNTILFVQKVYRNKILTNRAPPDLIRTREWSHLFACHYSDLSEV